MGFVYVTVDVSLMTHAVFGRNDQRKEVDWDCGILSLNKWRTRMGFSLYRLRTRGIRYAAYPLFHDVVGKRIIERIQMIFSQSIFIIRIFWVISYDEILRLCLEYNQKIRFDTLPFYVLNLCFVTSKRSKSSNTNFVMPLEKDDLKPDISGRPLFQAPKDLLKM